MLRECLQSRIAEADSDSSVEFISMSIPDPASAVSGKGEGKGSGKGGKGDGTGKLSEASGHATSGGTVLGKAQPSVGVAKGGKKGHDVKGVATNREKHGAKTPGGGQPSASSGLAVEPPVRPWLRPLRERVWFDLTATEPEWNGDFYKSNQF
jgi:hypothetical protein